MLIVKLQFSKLLENGNGDLVVHLNFSDRVIWPNLDICRSVSLPKMAKSFSPTNSVKKISIWQPVQRLEKIGALSFYLGFYPYATTTAK